MFDPIGAPCNPFGVRPVRRGHAGGRTSCAPRPAMLEWLTRTIVHLGYAGIGVLMFVENIVLPLPAEVIMPLGGFVAARGRLEFPLVLLFGFAGELLGALPW